MSKLEKIKAELAKLLVKYAVVKTDNGILEYEGEDLVADMDVYVTDVNGERVAAADGEYTTEDGKIITVANGKVASIVDPKAEVEDEVEAVEEDGTIDEQEEVVDEPTVDDGGEEQPQEEETIKMEDVNEAIDNLRKEVDELYKLVDSILKKVGESRDEADARLKKLECASQAKSAIEEFEQATAPKKFGDSKLDKFLSKYGN